MGKKLIFVLVVDSLMREFLIDFFAMQDFIIVNVYLENLDTKLKEYQLQKKLKYDLFLITDKFFFEKIKLEILNKIVNIFVCSVIENKNQNKKDNVIYLDNFSLHNLKKVINKINGSVGIN
jgi:hypothetical protein